MGIERSSRDRWIFGVCGGIAHRFGWNSLVVRLATVLLAIFIPGFSVIPVAIVYVILGYLLPESTEY
ncbi:MAG: PspC domain-containing protein [Rubrobacteraceae bacterium]|uniref:PspC domain-containing protein n=1 Tax=Rubrobacter naiadicus TaxID=1392641 RepID=UPI002361ECC9|nr:PspC domain-containing protein [Rubrobacter naiadicus]MBX6762356.1 PspC domain-containing protein [Rubrobacteraceae bacterium]MCL6437517.1 PspC domain-containing protein [Rubrobacteraceae bacterium]